MVNISAWKHGKWVTHLFKGASIKTESTVIKMIAFLVKKTRRLFLND